MWTKIKNLYNLPCFNSNSNLYNSNSNLYNVPRFKLYQLSNKNCTDMIKQECRMIAHV